MSKCSLSVLPPLGKKMEPKLIVIVVENVEQILISATVCNIQQIPLSRYLPTWRGNVIDAKLEMNPSRIVGFSLAVNAQGGVPGAVSGPGDFQVEVDWIKALRTQNMAQMITQIGRRERVFETSKNHASEHTFDQNDSNLKN